MNPSDIPTWLRWIPAVTYAGLIFVASSMPQPIPYIPIPHIDKPIHLLEYAILCLLICWALSAGTPGGTTTPLKSPSPGGRGKGEGESLTLPSPLKGESYMSGGVNTPGGSSLPIKKVVLFSILSSSLYGATDEIHQYFVPGRNAEVLDWVSDTIGASLAGFLWHKYNK